MFLKTDESQMEIEKYINKIKFAEEESPWKSIPEPSSTLGMDKCDCEEDVTITVSDHAMKPSCPSLL